LRNIASTEGYVIPASDLGKSKMALQVAGVGITMLGMQWPPAAPWGLWTMWAALLFTMASAVDYVRQFWTKIDVSVKQRRRRELLVLERTRRKLLQAERRASREAKKAGAGLGD
jgi:CDP-diacylglycerol--glycerol-3-phosphate 3-phosphatidyltransferase